jgi:hypothetical protein
VSECPVHAEILRAGAMTSTTTCRQAPNLVEYRKKSCLY